MDDFNDILSRVSNRQKQLENLSQYLHELEGHLSLIFAFSPDLIVLSNTEGKILRVNYAVREILGYKPTEIIGTSIWDYIHPDDVEKTKEIRIQLLQNRFFTGDKRSSFTNHWKKKDGGWARLVWRFSYYDSNNGWMIKFATDFSHIEADDLYYTQLIVNCVNHSSAGIVITDYIQEDNPIIYVNQQFENMSGYKREEILGSNPRLLNQEFREQLALDTLRDAITKGDGCEVLLKNFRPNGEEWYNHLLAEPVINQNDQVINYIGSSRDVTGHISDGTIIWDPNTKRGFGKI